MMGWTHDKAIPRVIDWAIFCGAREPATFLQVTPLSYVREVFQILTM